MACSKQLIGSSRKGKLPAPAKLADAVARRARRRITLRVLPYVLLLYVIAYLDRNNLATAALQMPHDLGFDDRVIGFGAGIFALGYVILEIPGTLIIERWSARRWITRIMISWGLNDRDGLYPDAAPVLRHTVLAGIGGGRVFPRDHRVSHPLVHL